ncbi:Mitochondrial matrix cochaperone [Ceratobasidium sp. 392]|nr:Mitochondrial matrix cochaperone [Ceratobasidium sp. 392]
MSVMVETGSLVDGEQPKLVPDDDTVPTPSSPVVTGMQALGLSGGELAEGEMTPTREDEQPRDHLAPASSLGPPGSSAAHDESPNTPLARSVEVEGPIVPVQLNDPQAGGLGVSIGEPVQLQSSQLTATNVHQLDDQSLRASSLSRPSGPSSVVVEAGSVAQSPSPSPAPGARTPEPASALTPKQSVNDLPPLAQGSVPLSAATLRLFDLEGGKKGGSRVGGAETPVSIMVETGSADGRPRDLEGVDAPVQTPAPASPAVSYFEEPKSGAVVQPDQRANRSETKDVVSSAEIANSEPDNRFSEQGPPVPPKNVPTIITNFQEPSAEDVASPTMKTPTNKKGAPFPTSNPTPSSRTLQKSHSRPNLSTASATNAPTSAPTESSQTLAAPNSGLQRRATTGSNNPKTTQRRRVSRVPQMQLLPSGQWGVVGDDSDDEEDAGGWAKVINRLRYAQADFLNLQRNAQREKEQTRDYAITKLAKDLVGTVDVLTLALKSVPEDARKGNQLYEGVEMTQRSLLQSLAKYGVEQFDPTGEKFDPNFHEALYMAPVPGKEPGTVLETQKLGYRIKDRVLRAAQVGVVQDAS